MVYALPPKGPGFFRSLFTRLLRFILILVVIFVIFAMIVGLISTLMMRGAGPNMTVYRSGDASQQIAIINLRGGIDAAAASFVRNAVEHVIQSDDIRAVVLRVDSPGGGVTASDHIWHEIERLRAEGTPVVASYGSVSASGGVYASCGSDFIFAEPTTITGSIGVIAQVMTFGDLLDKVGIEPVTLVAEGSPDKDVANDIYRAWDEVDKAKVQKILDASYQTFFDRVWEGRKHVITDEAILREIADGSIFTAEEALGHKLIDRIGYLDEAIDYAMQMVALSADAQIVQIDPWGRGFDLPFGLSLQQQQQNGAPVIVPISTNGRGMDSLDPESLRLWIHEMTRARAMYLMP